MASDLCTMYIVHIYFNSSSFLGVRNNLVMVDDEYFSCSDGSVYIWQMETGHLDR